MGKSLEAPVSDPLPKPPVEELKSPIKDILPEEPDLAPSSPVKQSMTRRFTITEKLKIIEKFKETNNASVTCR